MGPLGFFLHFFYSSSLSPAVQGLTGEVLREGLRRVIVDISDRTGHTTGLNYLWWANQVSNAPEVRLVFLNDKYTNILSTILARIRIWIWIWACRCPVFRSDRPLRSRERQLQRMVVRLLSRDLDLDLLPLASPRMNLIFWLQERQLRRTVRRLRVKMLLRLRMLLMLRMLLRL